MFFIDSPITTKELRPLLRSRKAFWLTLLVLSLAGGGIGLFVATLGANIYSMSYRAIYGRMIFAGLSFFMLCTLGLISPIVAATAITAEREANTLDLLVNTGLSRWRILLGKLAASLTWQLMLVILALPMMALPMQLGGVNMDEVLFAALMIAQTAVVYGMIGLAISSMMRKSIAALAVTLILIILIMILIPVFWVPIMRIFVSTGIPPLMRLNFNYSCSPLFTMLSYAESQALILNRAPAQTAVPQGNVFGILAGSSVFTTHLAIQALLFLSAWLAAMRGLGRRKAERVAVASKVIRDPAVLERRRKRWPYYLIDPLRSEQVISDGQNPVYIKERRVGIFSRPDPLIRCCYIGAMFSTIFCIIIMIDSQAIPLPPLALLMITPLGLICLTQGASSIAREREAQTLDLLTATPLAPRQVVRAKFRAIMRFVFFITLSLLAAPAVMLPLLFGIMFLTGQRVNMDLPIIFDTLKTLLLAMAFTLAYCSLYTSFGIFISTRCRRALTAIVVSFICATLMNVVLPAIASEVLHFSYYGIRLTLSIFYIPIICATLSPFYYFLSDPFTENHITYSIIDFNTWWMILIQILMVYGLSRILLWLASRRLARKARS